MSCNSNNVIMTQEEEGAQQMEFDKEQAAKPCDPLAAQDQESYQCLVFHLK